MNIGMVKKVNHEKVLIKGLQRRAIYRALGYPGSGAYILNRARHWAPKIGLPEVRRCIRDLEDKGLVHALNPDDTKNGRIYALTKGGAKCYEENFGKRPMCSLLYDGELHPLSVVLRSGLVKYVFSVLMQDISPQWHSATSIKKRLKNIHSTSIGGVVILAGRMVKDGYFEVDEMEVKDHLEKQYRMTNLALDVYRELQMIQRPPNWKYLAAETA